MHWYNQTRACHYWETGLDLKIGEPGDLAVGHLILAFFFPIRLMGEDLVSSYGLCPCRSFCWALSPGLNWGRIVKFLIPRVESHGNVRATYDPSHTPLIRPV